MDEFIRHLLNNEYMSQGYCFLWQPNILWLHVISDAVIAVVFMTMPMLLLIVAARRIRQRWILLMLALFGLLCGGTHLMSVVGVWSPYYYLAGLIKAGAACAALATLVMVVPLTPRLIRAIERLGDEADGEEDELDLPYPESADGR